MLNGMILSVLIATVMLLAAHLRGRDLLNHRGDVGGSNA